MYQHPSCRWLARAPNQRLSPCRRPQPSQERRLGNHSSPCTTSTELRMNNSKAWAGSSLKELRLYTHAPLHAKAMSHEPGAALVRKRIIAGGDEWLRTRCKPAVAVVGNARQQRLAVPHVRESRRAVTSCRSDVSIVELHGSQPPGDMRVRAHTQQCSSPEHKGMGKHSESSGAKPPARSALTVRAAHFSCPGRRRAWRRASAAARAPRSPSRRMCRA